MKKYRIGVMLCALLVALASGYAESADKNIADIKPRFAKARQLFKQLSKQPEATRGTSFRMLDELGFDLQETNGFHVVCSSNRAVALSVLDRTTRENGGIGGDTNAMQAIRLLHESRSVPRIVDGTWLDLRLKARNGLATNETVSFKISQVNELQLRVDAQKAHEKQLLASSPNIMFDTSAETLLAFSRMAIYLDSYGLVFNPDSRIWILVSDRKQHPPEDPETVRRYERIISESIELP
ncbi:MAG: hypothetical protein IJV65_02720 [Kiritimatiellae bacterium]|nr:hypothetical protein [Kiritimatiellia bacterium]